MPTAKSGHPRGVSWISPDSYGVMISDTVISPVKFMQGMFCRVLLRVSFSISVAVETLVAFVKIAGSVPVIGIIITVSVTAGITVIGVFRCGLHLL